MNNDVNFGEILRATRESRMISQKELAQKANIDPSHLNKIEKNIRMPSDDVLFRLADVLVAAELFQAAGRVVPEEFEKKYPLKRNPKLKKLQDFHETLPDVLKKLASVYQTQFDVLTRKKEQTEKNVKTTERIISTNTELFTSLKEKCTNTNNKDLISTASLLINLNYNLVGEMWDLELISWEKGIATGKMQAIIELWKEIQTLVEKDKEKFLVDFFQIEIEDAELIVAILEVLKKRKVQSSS